MIRADAPPIAPASAVSANWTSPASAGTAAGAATPRRRAYSANDARARSAPRKRASSACRSGADAVPFQTWTSCPSPVWRNTSTKRAACACSATVCRESAETITYAPMFASMLHSIACVMSLRPASPNSA